MIRINLLPVGKARKRNRSLIELIGLTAAVALALVGAVGVNMYYANQIDAQKRKIAEATEEIKRLKKIIGEVNELDKQKQRLIAQLKVIDKLEKGKRGPVRVLDSLSTNIPKRVWITSFSERKGKLTLTGLGLENADISEFMRALQKSPYFKGVELRFTQSQKHDGISIYSFQLVAKVDYSA
jgi:type IV pilus assembly protein PilN